MVTEINMRKFFAQTLFDEMSNNKNIILLTGDLGFGMLDNIKDTYPEQFYNMGSSEVLMAGAAVGATLQGKIVIMYSITPFLLYRPFEIIRNYINFERIPVKMVGAGRGRDYLHDGVSHWAEEDKLILKTFTNIKKYWPDSCNELHKVFHDFLYNTRPSYMNLKR